MATTDWEFDKDDIPAPAVIKVQREDRYGHVPGLEDEELADVAELERQVFIAEWGPILCIPWEPGETVIRPTVDQEGRLDWGAFGTVDFHRLRPRFNWAHREADKLQQELRNELMMMSMVQERLSLQERVEVIKAIQLGVYDPNQFHGEKRFYARRYLRARGIRRKIRWLRKYARQSSRG